MRRVWLIVTFLVLSGALWGLWQIRYEASPGFQTVTLADIRSRAPEVAGIHWSGEGRQTEVAIDVVQSKVSARFEIPGIGATKRLHVRYQLEANGLTRGNDEWEDGRVLVDWVAPSGEDKLETDPVSSVCGDEVCPMHELVVERANGFGVPYLRMENLGASGTMKLTELEVTVVQQRKAWLIGWPFLMMGWFFWCLAAIRSWPVCSRPRQVLASWVWLVMGIQFVVPGPWDSQRPMVCPFQLAPSTEGVHAAVRLLDGGSSLKRPLLGAIPAEGKLPERGSLPLRIKHHLAAARPLLHALLLFVPTLVMLCLVGRKPIWWLMAITAGSIELAQFLFGYGFDWKDVGDLICDAIGIAAGYMVHRYLTKQFVVRLIAD